MQMFSQRDPRWAAHLLGWGGKVGTIGAYGCYDTVCSMIAWACGFHYNPSAIDVLATNKKIFLKDSTGTDDFLPDKALDLMFEGRFKTTFINGFAAGAIAAALKGKNTYTYLHISTASVPTHFVWCIGLGAIVDPWWGAIGLLSGYGGPAAVVGTYIVEVLPDPAIAAAAAKAAALAAQTAIAQAAAQKTAAALASAQAAQKAADAAKALAAQQAAAAAEAAAQAAATAKPIKLPTTPPLVKPPVTFADFLAILFAQLRAAFG